MRRPGPDWARPSGRKNGRPATTSVPPSLLRHNPAMEFERTDFVSVPVADMGRAKAFYRDVLGLDSPDWDKGWPEIETGNVSLYLVDPTVMGNEFAPHVAPIALRVNDVAAAKEELEGRGLEFAGEQD